MHTMTKTFDPTEALALLDAVQDAITKYEALTGRHAKSDNDLRWRLDDAHEYGTLLNGVGVDNALLAFYEADEKPYLYGDDRVAEVVYEGFRDDVHDAMERIGILQDEEDFEDEAEGATA